MLLDEQDWQDKSMKGSCPSLITTSKMPLSKALNPIYIRQTELQVISTYFLISKEKGNMSGREIKQSDHKGSKVVKTFVDVRNISTASYTNQGCHSYTLRLLVV